MAGTFMPSKTSAVHAYDDGFAPGSGRDELLMWPLRDPSKFEKPSRMCLSPAFRASNAQAETKTRG